MFLLLYLRLLCQCLFFLDVNLVICFSSHWPYLNLELLHCNISKEIQCILKYFVSRNSLQWVQLNWGKLTNLSWTKACSIIPDKPWLVSSHSCIQFNTELMQQLIPATYAGKHTQYIFQFSDFTYDNKSTRASPKYPWACSHERDSVCSKWPITNMISLLTTKSRLFIIRQIWMNQTIQTNKTGAAAKRSKNSSIKHKKNN